MISIEERIKQLYEPENYDLVKQGKGYVVILKGLYTPKYKPLK